MRSRSRMMFGSPVYERLAGEILNVRVNFEHDARELELSCEKRPSWAICAERELQRADLHLGRWEIESGWDAVHAARRFHLANPARRDRLAREAIALRREAEKVGGWRGKTILDLLEDRKVTSPDGQMDAEAILDALGHRDHASQNTWFKITLRRRHLVSLFVLAALLIAFCVILSALHALDPYLGKTAQVLMTVLFGTLGGVVSVARSMVAGDVAARIPAQQIGAFVVWMRPILGAAAALVVIASWKAAVDEGVLASVAAQPPTAAGLAFLAGFSERFLVGTLARLSRDADTEAGPKQ